MIINNNDQKGSTSNDEVHHMSNEGSKRPFHCNFQVGLWAHQWGYIRGPRNHDNSSTKSQTMGQG